MPATLELALTAMLIAIALGIPLGLLAGLRPRSWPARIIMTLSTFGFALPTFWVGLILILFFAVFLGWLPAGGRGQTVTVLGVEWSFLTLDGLRHLPEVRAAGGGVAERRLRERIEHEVDGVERLLDNRVRAHALDVHDEACGAAQGRGAAQRDTTRVGGRGRREREREERARGGGGSGARGHVRARPSVAVQ
jgi:hypothetical protein